jgi:transketolase
MALAEKMDHGPNSNKYIYCLMSDGELNEGNTWEAIMFAGKQKFSNLIAIIDRNNIQIDGYTENIMPLEPLTEKFSAFNWHVIEIDGHNFDDIMGAVGEAQAVFGRPVVIIAHTIPGKGVAEFERKYEWHGKPPSREEGEKALRGLRTFGGKIKSEND